MRQGESADVPAHIGAFFAARPSGLRPDLSDPHDPHRVTLREPGGGTDFLARTVGQHLGESNKWTVVVKNRAGANGALGLGEVAKSEPSGHDLVLGQMDNLILAPFLTKVP